MGTADTTEGRPGARTRRHVLRSGARLAYSAPVLAATMRLKATGADAAISGGGRKLTASLNGFNEPWPGDPDGSGQATIVLEPGRLCFSLSVANIEPATQAHIHIGPQGRHLGGPVVFLNPPPTGGASSGCVSVPQDILDAIAASPADYYVNVHNGFYPGPTSAVRGQLSG